MRLPVLACGLAPGRNIGEDHLVTRTLVLAARVSAVVLLGGIVLASVAFPFWITFEDRAGEASLRKLGATFSQAKSGGLLVELPTQMSDDTLIKEGPHLERFNVAHLSLPHSRFTSLEPLKGLTSLSSLELLDAVGITSVEPLKGLTNLSSLDLSYATGVTSLEPLKGLTNLRYLYLDNATGITSLEPLEGLTNLASLDLRDAIGITSLEPLKGLTRLSVLNLSNTRITSLEPLKGLINLSRLYVDDAKGITSLEPLKALGVHVYGASDELLETMK
jgi:Leucine-rich repeat (LRR) protein